MLLTDNILKRSLYYKDETKSYKRGVPKKKSEKMFATNVSLSDDIYEEVKKVMRISKLSRSAVLRFLIKDGLVHLKLTRDVRYIDSRDTNNYSLALEPENYQILKTFGGHSVVQVMRRAIDIGLDNLYRRIDIPPVEENKDKVFNLEKLSKIIKKKQTAKLPEDDDHINTIIDRPYESDLDTDDVSEIIEDKSNIVKESDSEEEIPLNDVEEVEPEQEGIFNVDPEIYTKSISDQEEQTEFEDEEETPNTQHNNDNKKSVTSYNLSVDLSLDVTLTVTK